MPGPPWHALARPSRLRLHAGPGRVVIRVAPQWRALHSIVHASLQALIKSPAERPEAGELLQHPWIQSHCPGRCSTSAASRPPPLAAQLDSTDHEAPAEIQAGAGDADAVQTAAGEHPAGGGVPCEEPAGGRRRQRCSGSSPEGQPCAGVQPGAQVSAGQPGQGLQQREPEAAPSQLAQCWLQAPRAKGPAGRQRRSSLAPAQQQQHIPAGDGMSPAGSPERSPEPAASRVALRGPTPTQDAFWTAEPAGSSSEFCPAASPCPPPRREPAGTDSPLASAGSGGSAGLAGGRGEEQGSHAVGGSGRHAVLPGGSAEAGGGGSQPQPSSLSRMRRLVTEQSAASDLRRVHTGGDLSLPPSSSAQSLQGSGRWAAVGDGLWPCADCWQCAAWSPCQATSDGSCRC